MYDIAIIGGGPAGLSAAVTAKVRNKKVILFEANNFSPRLQKAHAVDNYLGMPGLTGAELMHHFVEHAQKMQVEIVKAKVLKVNAADDSNMVVVTADNVYNTQSIIFAVGVSLSSGIDGEKEYLGKGVSYCATCDGMFFKGKSIAVVSELSGAIEEVKFLAEICKEVYFVTKQNIDKSILPDNVQLVDDIVDKICGAGTVNGMQLKTGGYVPVSGVFVLRESDPVDNILQLLRLRGNSIFVHEHSAQTNLPGVFAAGDCTGQPWQISKATGEGVRAALEAVNYLGKL